MKEFGIRKVLWSDDPANCRIAHRVLLTDRHIGKYRCITCFLLFDERVADGIRLQDRTQRAYVFKSLLIFIFVVIISSGYSA